MTTMTTGKRVKGPSSTGPRGYNKLSKGASSRIRIIFASLFFGWPALVIKDLLCVSDGVRDGALPRRTWLVAESKAAILPDFAVHLELPCCSPAEHCHPARNARKRTPLRRRFRQVAQAG